MPLRNTPGASRSVLSRRQPVRIAPWHAINISVPRSSPLRTRGRPKSIQGLAPNSCTSVDGVVSRFSDSAKNRYSSFGPCRFFGTHLYLTLTVISQPLLPDANGSLRVALNWPLSCESKRESLPDGRASEVRQAATARTSKRASSQWMRPRRSGRCAIPRASRPWGAQARTRKGVSARRPSVSPISTLGRVARGGLYRRCSEWRRTMIPKHT